MSTTRRTFLLQSSAFPAWLVSQERLKTYAADQPPNILWIYAEDCCPELGCYGHPLVHTPAIDHLASEGVLFTQAFSTAPVCSASRSAIVTGMYQTSIGAHHHRSHRDDGYRLPAPVRPVMDYFREAGYFTCNLKQAAPGVKGTEKTDFNFSLDRAFDGTDWSQRSPGQPFYAQVNFPETHRTFKKAATNPVDPDEVELPPYYPDHPVAREDWALYLDAFQSLDNKVAAVLQRLKDEGLDDNTLVVFMGDNGRCHVRGKQWLYEGGIHVPLIVRWPGRIQAGTVRDDLVSLIDIAASSLSAAGIEPPPHMQGQDILGPDTNPRGYIVAARDRCDETMDRIRCVRTRELKYIRNYMPNRPYTQLNRYKETEYPVMRLLRRLHAEGKLNTDQARFMAEAKPVEELYDLRTDPHELHNLAVDADYAGHLKHLQILLDDWIRQTGDQGETPEDPSIVERSRDQMIEVYDKRLKQLYRQENMEWVWDS